MAITKSEGLADGEREIAFDAGVFYGYGQGNLLYATTPQKHDWLNRVPTNLRVLRQLEEALIREGLWLEIQSNLMGTTNLIKQIVFWKPAFDLCWYSPAWQGFYTRNQAYIKAQAAAQ